MEFVSKQKGTKKLKTRSRLYTHQQQSEEDSHKTIQNLIH